MIKRQNIAALYLRLSRDDGGDAESNSIQTQRIMLQKYAKDNGFVVFDEYVDDGISGTTFERPSFQRMIADIEAEKVTTVLTKDLSRLGRNNAMIAFYTEIFFPDRDIRLIALGDGIDTANGENEIMAFKSVINEYYARDISKKIKSAKKARAHNGEYSAYVAPLGYIKDPKNKHRLIVDEEGAKTVRYIFKLAVQGNGITRISRILNEEGIPTIRQYSAQKDEDFPDGLKAKTHLWCMGSVRCVLENKTYLGYVVNGKTTNKSFKNKKVVNIPEEQWIEIPNMHEPIIDMDTFGLAQKVIGIKRRDHYEQHENIFVGLLKCADCNGNLSLDRQYRKRTGCSISGFFMCNRYRSYAAKKENRLCSVHYTPEKLVIESVLAYIRLFAAKAKAHENDLETYARQFAGAKDDKALQSAQAEISRLSKRNKELDTIVERLFEEYALGKLSGERFQSMSEKYEQEQSDLKERLATLNKTVTEQKDAAGDAMRFMQEILPYTEAQALTREMLINLVDRIVVHEGSGRGKNRTQKLEIYFRLIGAIDPDTFFS